MRPYGVEDGSSEDNLEYRLADQSVPNDLCLYLAMLVDQTTLNEWDLTWVFDPVCFWDSAQK